MKIYQVGVLDFPRGRGEDQNLEDPFLLVFLLLPRRRAKSKRNENITFFKKIYPDTAVENIFRNALCPSPPPPLAQTPVYWMHF